MSALKLLLCQNCVEDHIRNTQSISCYCRCHSSKRDEEQWQASRDVILAELAALPVTPTQEKAE